MQYKETPVYVAAFYGHVEALNVLIRAKADVNAAKVVRKFDFHFCGTKLY